MFWLDRIFGQIEADLKDKIKAGKPLLVRDEKTASGRVHVGSMRALALHAAIAERLGEAGIPHTFKYEINDMDPMDGLPVYLDKDVYEKEMGKPLFMIPSPDGKAKNFAEYYGDEYKEAITAAGFTPEFYRASELYMSGKMDGVIREALEHASDIRRIYKEVSGGERNDKWLPISVICPQCGKMAMTEATDFDGETVQVTCVVEKRDAYTKGCGFSGRVSPFGGKAKLPWKPEWAAKWKVVGVDIEGGGKDHYSKGGAREVARHISEEVFHYKEPFGVPNEFFLVGGKKMSSSKGAGASAKDIVDLVPNKIFRLALFGKDINQQINFDPEGDTIPVLYDQYDKLAEGYKTNKDDDYARLFEYIHPQTKAAGSGEEDPSKSRGSIGASVLKMVWPSLRGEPRTFSRRLPQANLFLPRFSQVAFMVQMPHLNMEEEFARTKGAPLTVEDKTELAERAVYAKRWLDKYAPEKFVFKIQDTTPEEAKNLSDAQKSALTEVLRFIESTEKMPSGEDLQHKFHDIKEKQGIEPAQLFSAIYLSILGKTYGPKAGWFLSVLDRDFVIKRLKEVTQ